jgi:hypothetical protein
VPLITNRLITTRFLAAVETQKVMHPLEASPLRFEFPPCQIQLAKLNQQARKSLNNQLALPAMQSPETTWQLNPLAKLGPI